ncbi:syntaphilin [Denticeps clupeoides]|uniref:Syntaphilin-like n=1 Tax=Denticeps clupeoides TaxID=299321 RepID=A0AAY4EG45_9TELE|nr:syntaphilin-like [Denticeps clupeoides]XP_028849602.1 syntaphilin-like [Denticeps clupeoides]XP_028849603.1 syntaphilin-like [Denticeps clupeoides]
MSLPASRRTSAGSRRDRRSTASGSTRHSHGDSSTSSYSTGSCRGNDCAAASRSQPATPRRQAKHSTCTDNHGIRPPAPEQYLTPLQQKEVCIRHLRARLKENVERLQDRDSEIDGLRTQLVRMQEDWIEEECHRVEAQMALKEARKEIRQLQHVVETVRTNVSTRDPEHEPKSEGWCGPRLGPRPGLSRSCGCSPAHSLNRSATYTRLSTDTSPADRNGNVAAEVRPGQGKSKTLPRGSGRTHLLLEAALLAEQLSPRCPSVPRSATYERLCSGETLLPIPRPCHALNNNCSCSTHTYLPHHHLFLHLPQEDVNPPAPPQAPPLSEPAEACDRPGFRSQACSPTITWISEEGAGEELSVISTVTGGEPQPFPPSPSPSSPPPKPTYVDLSETPATERGPPADLLAAKALSPTVQTTQPRRVSLPAESEEVASPAAEEAKEEEDAPQEPPQRSHWSRYFLVDLLAVAVPVVPAVAWLCRRETLPVYHMGSLLRGCCAVALHSLRRMSGTRGRAPTSTDGSTQI